MRINWGRKGRFAGAFTVAFVTSVASSATSIHRHELKPGIGFEFRHITPATVAPSTAGINRHHVTPDFRFNFRHITPSGVAPAVSGIHRYQLIPDHKFNFRYITNEEEPDIIVIPPPVSSGGGGVYRRSRIPKDAILTNDDEEVLEILMAAFASGIFNQ